MSDVIAYFDVLEGGICLRVNRLSRLAWLRRLFAVVSRLGNGWFWGVMAALVFWQQGPASLPALFQVGVTALLGVFVYKALKHRLVRERPYINNGEILCGTAPLDRYSFPSGHTLHAVNFTIMFAHVEPTLLVVMAPFALLVALSRIVLGLHYPSDVVVGAAIGAILANGSLALM